MCGAISPFPHTSEYSDDYVHVRTSLPFYRPDIKLYNDELHKLCSSHLLVHKYCGTSHLCRSSKSAVLHIVAGPNQDVR
jgi:hypothetical protein